MDLEMLQSGASMLGFRKTRITHMLDKASQAVGDSGLAAWCTAIYHDLRWAISSSSNFEAVTHWSRDKEKAFVYLTVRSRGSSEPSYSRVAATVGG